MNEDNLTGITADIPAERLKRLYGLLSDETTPYALRVGKGANRRREITLYCEADDAAYFKDLLAHEIQAGI